MLDSNSKWSIDFLESGDLSIYGIMLYLGFITDNSYNNK